VVQNLGIKMHLHPNPSRQTHSSSHRRIKPSRKEKRGQEIKRSENNR
jgi:hypothetical protein